MAGQADGSIIIDTELSSEGFKAGSAELKAAIKSLSSTVKGLQKQMQKIGEQKYASDEFVQIQQDISQAEKYLDKYNQKLAKLSEKGKVDTPEWKALKDDIQAATAELDRLKQRKAEMESSGEAYISGTETEKYQSMYAALVSAKQKMVEMQSELDRINSKWAQMPTLSGYIKTAFQNVGNTIRSVFNGVGKVITHPLQSADRLLGSMVQNAGRFVSTIAKFSAKTLVSGIKSAASSMASMVKHSRSMKGQFGGLISGAKSFAMSLLGARGVYALLRKAVSAYMSENQQLSSTLSACWSGIGNALGPIIEKLINLVATAVAYVTQFLNLLGFVGKSTTKAISSAGGAASKETDKLKRQLASFDELNILSDNKSDSSGGGGASTDTGSLPDVTMPDWVKLMVDQLKSGQWAEAAKTLTSELNAMVASVDWTGIGTKAAYYLDGALTFLATAITTFDWFGLGTGLGEGINSIIHNVDWANLGIVLGAKFIALFGLLGGLVSTIDWPGLGSAIADAFSGLWNAVDWAQAGQTLSNGLIGVLNGLSSAIKNVDWQKIGNDVATFIANVDWSGVFTALSDGIGAACGGLAAFLWGLIEDAWGSVVDWWYDTAYDDGGFTMEGLLQGIWDGICNIGSWIKTNIFEPFINGFKSAFGIASPSTVMAEQGDFIVQGLLQGITEGWSSITGFFSNAVSSITEWLSSGWSTIKTNASTAWSGIKTTVTDAWSGIKANTANAYTSVKDGVTSTWTSIKSGATSSWSTVKSTVTSAWSKIKSSTSSVSASVESNTSSAFTKVKDYITSKMTDAGKNAEKTWGEIKSTTTTIGSNISSDVSSAWSKIQNYVKTNLNSTKATTTSTWNAMKSTITSATNNMSSAVSSKFSAIHSTIQSKVNSAKSAITSGFESARSAMVSKMTSAMNTIKGQGWYSVGTNICSGIQSGLNAGWSWLSNTVSNLARRLLNSAKSALGIHSPSRVFRDAVGLNIGYGIGEGIENSEGSVLGSVCSVADAIKDEFNANEYTMGGVVSDTEIDGTLTNFSDKIANSFTALMDRLQAIADSTAFQIPVAATNMIPYKSAVADSTSGNTDENGDISSVVIQAVANATAAIVAAIQEYAGADISLDGDKITESVISGINRKTRMNGKSPLLL